jgi:hypothetical protein
VLKHQVPTVGAWGLGRVKVESFPLRVGVLSEPIPVPPLQGVIGAVSRHSVQLTAPLGAPPAAFPATVAVSPQVLPTEVPLGGRMVVVKPGVAAVTRKHSAESTVPEMLSLEPVKLDPDAGA